MHAVIQRRYGGTEQLELADVPAPTAGPGEVLVRVRAAGLDRGTWHLMTGLPFVVRPMFGLLRPRNPIPGRDVAGVVEELGPGVTRFAVSDEVMGTARGSFAELATVQVSRLARKPAGLDFAGNRPVSLLRRALTRTGTVVIVGGEHGDLRPVLDRTYTLDEAAKAIDHLAAGHVRGRVALTL